LVLLAADDVELVIGQLAPLFLGLALELFPVAFDAVPVHVSFSGGVHRCRGSPPKHPRAHRLRNASHPPMDRTVGNHVARRHRWNDDWGVGRSTTPRVGRAFQSGRGGARAGPTALTAQAARATLIGSSAGLTSARVRPPGGPGSSPKERWMRGLQC